MSKKNKKKNNKVNIPKKRKSKKLPIIIVSAVLIVTIAVIIIFSVSSNANISELCDYAWIPTTAHNASGDEVEMSEVYSTNYSSYQGSLTFKDDGTFSLWLSPGTPDDGTHSGTYKLEADNKISAQFDEGTLTTFDIVRENGNIKNIKVNYNTYEVYFSKQ